MRVNPDGTETPDPSHPILALLRGDANDWTTGPQLIRDLTTDALCDDAGGLAMVNRVGTRVMEIIHPTRGAIFVERDQVTRQPTYRLQGQPLGAQNVIHLTAPLGRAPLTLAREARRTPRRAPTRWRTCSWGLCRAAMRPAGRLCNCCNRWR